MPKGWKGSNTSMPAWVGRVLTDAALQRCTTSDQANLWLLQPCRSHYDRFSNPGSSCLGSVNTPSLSTVQQTNLARMPASTTRPASWIHSTRHPSLFAPGLNPSLLVCLYLSPRHVFAHKRPQRRLSCQVSCHNLLDGAQEAAAGADVSKPVLLCRVIQTHGPDLQTAHHNITCSQAVNPLLGVSCCNPQLLAGTCMG